MQSRYILQSLALVGLFIVPAALQAVILTPGGTVPNDPALSVGLNTIAPFIGNATLVATTGPSLSGIASGLQTEYMENVYLDPVGNAACPLGGCLDFVIAVLNVGTHPLEH